MEQHHPLRTLIALRNLNPDVQTTLKMINPIIGAIGHHLIEIVPGLVNAYKQDNNKSCLITASMICFCNNKTEEAVEFLLRVFHDMDVKENIAFNSFYDNSYDHSFFRFYYTKILHFMLELYSTKEIKRYEEFISAHRCHDPLMLAYHVHRRDAVQIKKQKEVYSIQTMVKIAIEENDVKFAYGLLDDFEIEYKTFDQYLENVMTLVDSFIYFDKQVEMICLLGFLHFQKLSIAYNIAYYIFENYFGYFTQNNIIAVYKILRDNKREDFANPVLTQKLLDEIAKRSKITHESLIETNNASKSSTDLLAENFTLFEIDEQFMSIMDGRFQRKIYLEFYAKNNLTSFEFLTSLIKTVVKSTQHQQPAVFANAIMNLSSTNDSFYKINTDLVLTSKHWVKFVIHALAGVVHMGHHDSFGILSSILPVEGRGNEGGGLFALALIDHNKLKSNLVSEYISTFLDSYTASYSKTRPTSKKPFLGMEPYSIPYGGCLGLGLMGLGKLNLRYVDKMLEILSHEDVLSSEASLLGLGMSFAGSDFYSHERFIIPSELSSKEDDYNKLNLAMSDMTEIKSIAKTMDDASTSKNTIDYKITEIINNLNDTISHSNRSSKSSKSLKTKSSDSSHSTSDYQKLHGHSDSSIEHAYEKRAFGFDTNARHTLWTHTKMSPAQSITPEEYADLVKKGIIDTMINAKSERVKRSAGISLALMSIFSEKITETMLNNLKSYDPVIRYGGVFALGASFVGSGNSNVIQKLLSMTNDQNEDVQRASVFSLALVMCNDISNLKDFLIPLFTSHSRALRGAACISLGFFLSGRGDLNLALEMESLLEDQELLVKQSACLGLGMLLVQFNEKLEFYERLSEYARYEHTHGEVNRNLENPDSIISGSTDPITSGSSGPITSNTRRVFRRPSDQSSSAKDDSISKEEKSKEEKSTDTDHKELKGVETEARGGSVDSNSSKGQSRTTTLRSRSAERIVEYKPCEQEPPKDKKKEAENAKKTQQLEDILRDVSKISRFKRIVDRIAVMVFECDDSSNILGPIFGRSLLEAGGRNCIFTIFTQDGLFCPKKTACLILFLQYWYNFSMIPFLSICTLPTFFYPVKANLELSKEKILNIKTGYKEIFYTETVKMPKYNIRKKRKLRRRYTKEAQAVKNIDKEKKIFYDVGYLMLKDEGYFINPGERITFMEIYKNHFKDQQGIHFTDEDI